MSTGTSNSAERSQHRELPAILNWTLDGLERLAKAERLTDDILITLADLASPVAASVARADAVAHKRHGAEAAPAMLLEWTASMVATSAAAHALDALYEQLVTKTIKADGPYSGARREAHYPGVV